MLERVDHSRCPVAKPAVDRPYVYAPWNLLVFGRVVVVLVEVACSVFVALAYLAHLVNLVVCLGIGCQGGNAK